MHVVYADAALQRQFEMMKRLIGQLLLVFCLPRTSNHRVSNLIPSLSITKPPEPLPTEDTTAFRSSRIG